MNSIESSALGKKLWGYFPGRVVLGFSQTTAAWEPLLQQGQVLLAWRLDGGSKKILGLGVNEMGQGGRMLSDLGFKSGWPIVEASPPFLEGFGFTALIMAKGIARRPASWPEELPFVVQALWLEDDAALIWITLPNKSLLDHRLRALRSRTQAGSLRLVGFVEEVFHAEYSGTHERLHWEARWGTGYDQEHVWLRDKPGKN